MLDVIGCRRLAAAALLKAALDAHAGDESAAAWISTSETARILAELIGLGDIWPPAPGQLRNLRQLQAAARSLFADNR